MPLIERCVDDVVLVGEDDIEQAVLVLLDIEKTVIERAGAVGLAALMKHGDRFGGRKVGLIPCGGNIEPLVLAETIERGMVKPGRLARLCFDVHDMPGALAGVAQLLGALGANIDEVQHPRAFTALSVERAQVEVVVQTRGLVHIAQILDAMRCDAMRCGARGRLSRRARRLNVTLRRLDSPVVSSRHTASRQPASGGSFLSTRSLQFGEGYGLVSPLHHFHSGASHATCFDAPIARPRR